MRKRIATRKRIIPAKALEFAEHLGFQLQQLEAQGLGRREPRPRQELVRRP